MLRGGHPAERGGPALCEVHGGVDQGLPGEQNKGIFVELTEKASCRAAGEEYQLTHPTASINGLLRGSIWVAIADQSYITCRGGRRDGEEEGKPGKRLRTILEYKEEVSEQFLGLGCLLPILPRTIFKFCLLTYTHSALFFRPRVSLQNPAANPTKSWLAKAKYAVEGVVYEYDEGAGEDPDEYSKIKQVPQDRVVATIDGVWRGDIHYKLKGEKVRFFCFSLDQTMQTVARELTERASLIPPDEQESRLLLRLDDLQVTPKTVRPLEAHDAMESRKIWQPVTEAIVNKEYSAATKHKQEIEQAQRDIAAERKKTGER